MKEENNRQIVLYSILRKHNHDKISVLVYRKPTYTNQYLQTSCKESIVSSFINRVYFIITNKDDLTKQNARTMQVIDENGCQESVISKILKRITINHSLLQSQQQTQAIDIQKEEIRINIKLSYVEGTRAKLRCIFRYHKIRSNFYTEKTLRKLLCKPKVRRATKDDNNNKIVY